MFADISIDVRRLALALQTDGRGQHQAGHGDDGKHAAAEHDVERAFHGAVAQARAIPILHGLHGLVAHARIAAAHGLRNERGPIGAFCPVTSLVVKFKSTSLIPGIPQSMNSNCE